MKLLICCWKDHKSLIGNGRNTKKDVFEKIANAFNAKSDLKVSGGQCLRKWAKLEGKLKEVTDHNNKSGNAKRSWKYYTDMEECIGGNPSVNPQYTLESSSTSGPSDDVSSSSDDENQGTTPKKKTPSKRPSKKRKSRSSAAEMLDFLRDYQQQREEVENKKVRILQEMNKEKKAFWANLLEVMKTGNK